MTNPSSDLTSSTQTSTQTSAPTGAPTSVPPGELPATVRGFLDAHAARDVDAALRAFATDAVVTDQGRTYRGVEEVAAFLRDSGAEFTWTTELVGAEREDDGRWVALSRIQGDFPGGTADLRYRFTVRGDLVDRLEIGA